jgi:hypothetical protein
MKAALPVRGLRGKLLRLLLVALAFIALALGYYAYRVGGDVLNLTHDGPAADDGEERERETPSVVVDVDSAAAREAAVELDEAVDVKAKSPPPLPSPPPPQPPSSPSSPSPALSPVEAAMRRTTLDPWTGNAAVSREWSGDGSPQPLPGHLARAASGVTVAVPRLAVGVTGGGTCEKRTAERCLVIDGVPVGEPGAYAELAVNARSPALSLAAVGPTSLVSAKSSPMRTTSKRLAGLLGGGETTPTTPGGGRDDGGGEGGGGDYEGRHAVTFEPVEAGRHLVYVTLEYGDAAEAAAAAKGKQPEGGLPGFIGRQIPGSPFTVEVSPSEVRRPVAAGVAASSKLVSKPTPRLCGGGGGGGGMSDASDGAWVGGSGTLSDAERDEMDARFAVWPRTVQDGGHGHGWYADSVCTAAATAASVAEETKSASTSAPAMHTASTSSTTGKDGGGVENVAAVEGTERARRLRLLRLDGGTRTVRAYSRWESRTCRLCRFDKKQGAACLKRTAPLLMVGDSVMMQLCRVMQCALHVAEGGNGNDCILQGVMRQGIPGTDPDLGCDNCRVPAAAKGVIECSSFDNFTGVGNGRGGDRHLSAVQRMSDADLDAAVGGWGERGSFGRGRKPTIVMNVGMHDLTFVGDAETTFTGEDNPDPGLRRSPHAAGTFDRLLRAVGPGV